MESSSKVTGGREDFVTSWGIEFRGVVVSSTSGLARVGDLAISVSSTLSPRVVERRTDEVVEGEAFFRQGQCNLPTAESPVQPQRFGIGIR